MSEFSELEGAPRTPPVGPVDGWPRWDVEPVQDAWQIILVMPDGERRPRSGPLDEDHARRRAADGNDHLGRLQARWATPHGRTRGVLQHGPIKSRVLPILADQTVLEEPPEPGSTPDLYLFIGVAGNVSDLAVFGRLNPRWPEEPELWSP